MGDPENRGLNGSQTIFASLFRSLECQDNWSRVTGTGHHVAAWFVRCAQAASMPEAVRNARSERSDEA